MPRTPVTALINAAVHMSKLTIANGASANGATTYITNWVLFQCKSPWGPILGGGGGGGASALLFPHPPWPPSIYIQVVWDVRVWGAEGSCNCNCSRSCSYSCTAAGAATAAAAAAASDGVIQGSSRDLTIC